jgi:hypothetical protein
MTIEIQALSALLLRLDQVFASKVEDGQAIRQIAWAIQEAKYWIAPMQTFRDTYYTVWDNNKHWGREVFLHYVGDKSQWALRCICLGDMNYRVENEGFSGWLDADNHALKDDFDVLFNLCRDLKTPVGYEASAIISSVQLLSRLHQERGTYDSRLRMDRELELETAAYLRIRYDLMVQVEQKLRAEVPVFRPTSWS